MTDAIEVEIEVIEDPVTIPDISLGEQTIPIPDIPKFDPQIPPIPTPVFTEREFTLPEFTIPVPDIQDDTFLLFLPELPSIRYVKDLSLGLDVETNDFDLLGFEDLVTLPVSVELEEPDIDDRLAVFDFPRVLEIPTFDVSIGQETIGDVPVPFPGVDIVDTPIPLPSFGPIPISDLVLPDISVDLDGQTVPIPVDITAGVKVNEKELLDLLPVSIPQGFTEDPRGYVFTVVVEEIRDRIGKGLVGTLRELLDDILDEVLSAETKERLSKAAGNDDT